jgi:spore coat polysaccharide biosynthesis protein SpsF (cytidylyltransferase family)
MTKVPVILQVRTSSSRLPNKALLKVNEFPLIYWQIKRILRATLVEKIVIATTDDKSDDLLSTFLSSLGLEVYRGNKDDVLTRYLSVLRLFDFKKFVRLTGDCPLISPALIDEMIKLSLSNEYDYVTNNFPPTFPDGQDIEIVKTEALLELNTLVSDQNFREHVTLGFRKLVNAFTIYNLKSKVYNSDIRMTIDYIQDLDFITKLFSYFKNREIEIELEEIIETIKINKIFNKIGNDYRNIAIKGII